MRVKFVAFALVLALASTTAPLAQTTCKQSLLGTSSVPIKWSIYAPGENGEFTECIVTVKGQFAVSGWCRAKNVAKTNVRTANSNLTLASTCKLTGRLDSPGVLATLDGTFRLTGWPGMHADGWLTRLRPSSTVKFPFTMFGIGG